MLMIKPITKMEAGRVYEIQQKAYASLLEKYQDFDTNPGAETLETVIEKIEREDTTAYIFMENGIEIGWVRILLREEGVYCVSSLAVLPEYWNRGIAQEALGQIERIYKDARIWKLDTILQEAGNCHLYEKLGYKRAGEARIINDKLTLIDYIKVVEKTD